MVLIIFKLFHFRAFGGDKDGSVFLQAFATFLKDQYLKRPLDRIYLMVKKTMIEAQQIRYYTSGYIFIY